jgi:hypothetical protein
MLATTTASTMILDDHAAPLIPSDGVVKTSAVGVMTERRLGPEAAQALAFAAPAPEPVMESSYSRSRRTRDRYRRDPPTAMDPALSARLERLGIIEREPHVKRPGFRVIDIPL